MNKYANIREYMISFMTNLTIAGPNSILLQPSSIAELTAATNQLTRLTAVGKIYLFQLFLFSLNR